ncbi:MULTISPECIES: hypothetical protein [Paeniglutamicibacter]|uniref:DUF1461 domain-containing protein n=1 Tax=Paeniglutamicibacter sulfureus TaxID=43666 RepID=A0ABU2BPQ8_9MICC|nr:MULTISPECIES: hypothetical protein [Paeniglutamicibacter]MCV9994899.1 hypothetical protein [Paeniglutamicibacter sp. ZC-3]MDO2935032.1 hypothetical protein [Paeniglutamicibacter sulfureus]MDR7359344.1 hypothetical protein [Paeniglutamicibacter sulfureus]
MSRDLDPPLQRLGHIGGRTFLLTVSGVATVAGLLAVFYLAWFTEETFTRSFFFEASLVTPPSDVPDLRGVSGASLATYGTAIVESDEGLLAPRLALAAAQALYFLLFIAGCAAVILICRRLWKNEPFTTMAHWMLLALGTLAGVTALIAPWLETLSTHLAVTELGFPGSGSDTPGASGDGYWLATSAEFSFQDANHSLLALGVVLILLSLVLRRGRSMQLDAAGLV